MTAPRHPRVLIFSEHTARLHVPRGREVCISITDPGKPAAVLADGYLDILRLAFTDIDQPPDAPPWIVLFTPAHAAEVVRFVQQWKDVDRIVIHCRAGLSRSPAIAMGLCDLFSWPLGDMERQHPLCNRWVRKQFAIKPGAP